MRRGTKHTPETIERIRQSAMQLPQEFRLARARKGAQVAHERNPDLWAKGRAIYQAKVIDRKIDRAVSVLREHAPNLLILAIRR